MSQNEDDLEQKYLKVAKTMAANIIIHETLTGTVVNVNRLQEEMPYFKEAMLATNARLMVFYQDETMKTPSALIIGDKKKLAEDVLRIHQKLVNEK